MSGKAIAFGHTRNGTHMGCEDMKGTGLERRQYGSAHATILDIALILVLDLLFECLGEAGLDSLRDRQRLRQTKLDFQCLDTGRPVMVRTNIRQS